MKKRTGRFMASILAFAFFVCFTLPALTEDVDDTKTIRIIGTSDLHGKFMPWDYALNAARPSGSMTQLATAIAQYRTETTLLVDAGDTIQENSADIFIGNGETHPPGFDAAEMPDRVQFRQRDRDNTAPQEIPVESWRLRLENRFEFAQFR